MITGSNCKKLSFQVSTLSGRSFSYTLLFLLQIFNALVLKRKKKREVEETDDILEQVKKDIDVKQRGKKRRKWRREREETGESGD